jgi:DNA-binding transcriptional ArsR family regulator
MNEQDIVRALAALAQHSRLQIFRKLVVAGQGGMTPTQLSEVLGLPSTGLSFHLKELTHAGLITQQRDGRYLIYRAAFSTMNEVLAYLTLNCCEGEACEMVDVSAVCTSC